MIHIYLLIALVNDLSGEEILSHMTELLETCVNGHKIVAQRTCGNADDPESDRTGARFSAADGTLADCRNDSRHRKCGECCNRVGGRLRGADPQLLWRDGNAGTARSRHAPRRSASWSFFRLLAAAQPVSDKRIAGCLAAAGKGYAMLLRLLLNVEPVSPIHCNPGGNFFLERV